MRNSKIIKIGDNEITIKELRIKDIFGFFNSGQMQESSMLELIKSTLSEISDITIEQFDDMSFSEINQLIEGFKEVNKDFFALLSVPEVKTVLETIKGHIFKGLQTQFAGLSQQGMDK